MKSGTENIKKIIDAKPVFFVRWGMLFLFTILLLLVFLAVIIQYPQLTKAEIKRVSIPVIEHDINSEVEIVFNMKDRSLLNISEGTKVNIYFKDSIDNPLGNLSGIIVNAKKENEEIVFKIMPEGDNDRAEKDYKNLRTAIPAGTNGIRADIIYFNYSLLDAILFNFKIRK